MSSGKDLRVAIDVGGTFIDFVLIDEQTGRVRIEKIASLPDELAGQLVAGLESFDVEAADVRQIFHGMTVGVNALIQERGAKVGLLTTRGFRDVLEMGRGGRTPVYDFVAKAPPPIVPRFLRREVTERLDVRGNVVQVLNTDELDREIDNLMKEGVEAISVAFLHAYANPVHELAARERIVAKYPQIPVSLSHEIAGVWREFERTSTTTLNSFIQPTVTTYLDSVQAKLESAGYDAPVAIMQSSGGAADLPMAAAKPIRTLMSGPAGGVIGAAFLCERLGLRNVICSDVGGTTYDVALIEEGRILERSQTEIGGRPILGSLIDVTSIGAGGGSIGWLDHRNALQVGPRSAGASPGPACFGKGGKEPTTTDAHVLLGWLDPEYFLGGRMKLNVNAARTAVEELGAKLGLGWAAAARGIVAIAENNMANAIRTKTVARGLDPREFVLLAYGGGGGVFACAVAAELGVRQVVVPFAPANFSAWGILTTDYMEDEVRTKVLPFTDEYICDALTTLEELEGKALHAIRNYGFSQQDINVVRRLDVRYLGQEYTLTVALDPGWTEAQDVLAGARREFVKAHRQLYGHGEPDAPMELVSVRSRAIGKVKPPIIAEVGEPETAIRARERPVYFAGNDSPVSTQVLDRESLPSGRAYKGPVIIEEWTTTTVVPPGWRVTRDRFGNLVIDSEESAA
jgi:N-methylhydantoinase A